MSFPSGVVVSICSVIIWDDLRYAPIHPHIINQPVEKLLVELIRKERSFTACDFLLLTSAG